MIPSIADSVTEIFESPAADDTCYGSISMYEDWIFAGQFVYKTDDDSVLNTTCKQFELAVYADYPDNLEALKIMARVIFTGSEENKTNTNKILNIYDDVNLNESKCVFLLFLLLI